MFNNNNKNVRGFIMSWEEFLEDISFEILDEFDDLEIFIAEDNPLVVSEKITHLRKLLKDLEERYNLHISRIIKGEKDD